VPGRWGNARALARLLRPSDFDAALALFSRFDVALGLALAGIPMRVASATKPAQVLYTHRLRQRRSQSTRPEWLYNLELAEFFLAQLGVSRPIRTSAPYLSFPVAEVTAARHRLADRLGIDSARSWVFVHPGHGGSSPTLPTELFARIGRELAAEGVELILSEGPADKVPVEMLSAALGATPHVRYRSLAGLDAYARDLAAADLFLSGSTGPLHIAGALDVATVAFYPHRRSASATRWQTLNGEDRRLAFMPPSPVAENDFAAIDMGAVVGKIKVLLARLAPDRGHAPTSRHT
jgi:ADP-heptose:LPS heptosyltransferase